MTLASPKFHVREATEDDATAIHALGSNAPELAVGGLSGGFPSLGDLEDDIGDSEWIVLESDRGHVWGFCCARRSDTDRRASPESACLVYLFVENRWRHNGLAKKLMEYMLFKLNVLGVGHVYAWANPSSGVVRFFDKQGFATGKTCVWMDCDLRSPRTSTPPPLDEGRK